MIENRYLNPIIAIVMAIAVMLTTLLVLYPEKFTASSTSEPEYMSKIFNKDQVTQIDINIEQEDFNWIIENATKEEYRNCDITINGNTINNVGIRPKGNSSLKMVAGDKTTDRFSFKVEFDTYIKGQTCFGLNKLVLNNMMSDAIYMKEYLSYDLFTKMGVITPAYTYANITINGKPWGLYLMVEPGEESYLERNFGNDYGKLYKPEGTGSDLKWVDEKASSYSGVRDSATVKVTDLDFDRIVEMIKNLDSGTDLEKYLDIDATLRYFVVNTLLVNLDSYVGNFKHNYYLYEHNGKCTILPWDLNMSFAGFQNRNAQQAVDFSIDSPFTGKADDFPLISKLLEVPEYKALYHKYINETVELYFDSGLFNASIDKLDHLINSYVKSDATAFYTYEQYEKSLPALKEFGKLRAASVTAQLAGKTTAGAVNFDLSALGSMGGKAGFGGGGKDGGLLGDTNLPDMETMQAAMRIFEEAQGDELTNAQLAELKKLGFDDSMIERFKNMPAGIGGPNGNRTFPNGNHDEPPDRPNGFPDGNRPFDRQNKGDAHPRVNPQDLLRFGICLAVCSVFLVAGLLFVLKFRRRKYRSA